MPRFVERVQDDGNSAEDDDEEGNVENQAPECMAVKIHMVSL